jgi:glycosyltransferase involved in cell wall biosynthesis
MASSVPVIATDAGGVKDLLGSGKGKPFADGYTVAERGVLCPRGDSRAFAGGMRYLAGLAPMERARALQRARSFVVAAYSKERLLKDIEALYEELNRGDIPGEQEDKTFGYSRKTDTDHRRRRTDRFSRGGRAA